MATVERQFCARSTAYEGLQLGVLDATAHERVDVAEGDRRKGDRSVAQLQTEQPLDQMLTEIACENCIFLQLQVPGGD